MASGNLFISVTIRIFKVIILILEKISNGRGILLLEEILLYDMELYIFKYLDI